MFRITIINAFSSIISVIAVIYLLYIITTQTAKGLRTGFLLLAVGILISVAANSFSATLERCGVVSTGLLIQIMPILVLIGSLLVLGGAYILYKTFREVSAHKGK